ncbi:MAG: hypothetical protein KKB20_16780 [Proteobacteria bacterium]|nr:hypothetical protein [Pseudomonadota bacterium]
MAIELNPTRETGPAGLPKIDDMLRTKIFEASVAARISRPQQEAGEKSD